MRGAYHASTYLAKLRKALVLMVCSPCSLGLLCTVVVVSSSKFVKPVNLTVKGRQGDLHGARGGVLSGVDDRAQAQ
jgi:hypothetical protein